MPTRESDYTLTRRDLATLVAAALATPASAQPTNPNPPLDIADWSYYFYGVELATLARGTVVNGMQMYVEHWIPTEVRHPYPVVLVHGGYSQGSDWISTPDGRRGWATLFLEQGYKVYVVDRPGQGRNPYHPYLHGYFDDQAPTFEAAARDVKSPQWPGNSSATSPEIAQHVAALGQPMGNGPLTRTIWRTRAAMLLDEIGPAIFVTHGDGSNFAWVIAEDRPQRIKAIVAVEQTANTLAIQNELRNLAAVPIAVVSGESSPHNVTDAASVTILRQAGFTVEHIRLADKGIRGNGPMLHLEKNNREALQPILAWLDTTLTKGAPAVVTRGVDPARNGESTALKLADQGCLWTGIRRKQMPYGSIAQGQCFVQYMIPAERKYRYPVVMIHGGGGQGTHMMGIGRRPGWVHYFVQAGYAVYWLDRPSYGRSPYHPDALGPSHLRNVPGYEGLITSTAVFNTAQWPGPGGMDDPVIGQFMACESGNVADEAFHSDLTWNAGAELLDRIGESILLPHAFGGFFAWGVADRRPKLVKAIFAMEINGNPFAAQLRWGLTAAPMTYDPPVTDLSQFRLVDRTPPPDMPRPVVSPFKLQADPVHKWPNLRGIPIGWLTTEYGGGGSPVSNVEFLKQVGCDAEMVRLRDYGIHGNGNLMLLDKNNHEVFTVVRDWLDRKLGSQGRV